MDVKDGLGYGPGPFVDLVGVCALGRALILPAEGRGRSFEDLGSEERVDRQRVIGVVVVAF